MELKVIAYARNGHTDKFGIPRQSREESPILTRIVFEPEFAVREALRGIEGYSHLWLIWGFHHDRYAERVKTATLKEQRPDMIDWSPTVRPPRLGGNKRMGVFATRSPFRPNPIGLTSVKLVKVQRDNVQGTKDSLQGTKGGGLELLVSGADLLDGTPIYDIKPYLSFSDSHPEAKNGFAEETKDRKLSVRWDLIPGNRTVDGTVLPREWLEDATFLLSQDPRPGYQDDPEREYKLDYAGYTVTFVVQGQEVIVKKTEKV